MKGVKSQLNNLGSYAWKDMKSKEINSEENNDVYCDKSGSLLPEFEAEQPDTAFGPGFPSSNTSQVAMSSLRTESNLDEIEVLNDADMESFAVKMQQILQDWLNAAKQCLQPSRYSIFDPAECTKHRHHQKTRQEMKVLHLSGHPNIQSFWRQGYTQFPASVISISSEESVPLVEQLDVRLVPVRMEEEEEEENGAERILPIFSTSDERLGWQEASLLAAKAAGCSTKFARSLRTWIWDFLKDDEAVPKARYGNWKSHIHDKDVSEAIQLHLQGLGNKYSSAMDVVCFLDDPKVKARSKFKKTSSECTCHKWLLAIEFHFGKGEKEMYIDGYEHEDIVDYHQNAFLLLWARLEPFMQKWLANRCCASQSLCHWFQTDKREGSMLGRSQKPEPVRKGVGASIMVSDFCSPDIGWLKSKDGTREARILFKAGKNHYGYFNCDDLCKQTELAIKLFEDNFPDKSAITIFGFDNAPGHQKRALDALFTRYMPKGAQIWLGKAGNAKMLNGRLPNGDVQEFYYPNTHLKYPGFFKGMSKILEEQGLLN
ncbi:hypothetical protein M422DRAFT_248785 [Sphaerobolus stellatus SS14]|nr:hypothetical protein M422DRAFT_248785 [Sphaerobolus stellatus SS14]